MKLSKRIACAGAALVLLSACAPETKEDPAVQAMHDEARAEEQMLSAVATYVDAWDTGDVTSLDALMAADVTRTAPDANANNLDELKAFIGAVRTIYPDFGISNDGMAAADDTVFVQWTVTGTYSADGMSKPIEVTGISRYDFADGKIVSELVRFDTGELLSQLGMEELPAP